MSKSRNQKNEWPIEGGKKPLWLSQLFLASLALLLRFAVSLVTRRYLSIMGLRILINDLKGRVPKGCLCAGREGSCAYERAHTRGLHAVGDFMWMDDSFNFTPQQRWYPASTTSNQFCKSHFVAENWFTVPVPFWRPNFPGGTFAELGQLKDDSFSLNWNDSTFFHRLILNYPCFYPLIKMIKTAQIIFCTVLLIFFFFLETQKSRLALDICCLTYRSITPSILAWTVYHCTLNSF